MFGKIIIDWTIRASEFVTAASIIAGIITFLIKQHFDKRRDTKVANRDIYQRLELASIELFRFDADSKDVTRFLWAEKQNLPKEGTVERYSFLNYVCQILNLFEMSIRFRKEKIMPAEVFGSWVIWYYDLFSRPNFLPIWKEVKLNYTCDLRRIVDKCLEIESKIDDEQLQKEQFFRFVADEVHDHGFVLNMLFCGNKTQLMKKCVGCPSNPKEKSVQIKASDIAIEWCTEPKQLDEAALFFTANVTSDYISHGEIFDGRALDFNTWRHDLTGYMQKEFRNAALNDANDDPEYRLAIARKKTAIVGIALLLLHRGEPSPYIELSDIVVKRSMHSKGVGTFMYSWLENELRKTSISNLFLESSMNNRRAQSFFTEKGYHTVSKVMMKQLK